MNTLVVLDKHIIGLFAASKVSNVPQGFQLLEVNDDLLDRYFSLKKFPADVVPLDALLNAVKSS